MPNFSKKSIDRLSTVHPLLSLVMYAAIKRYDFTVLYGRRTPEEQFELYQKGRSLVNGKWVVTDKHSVVTNCDGRKVMSNHNYNPSIAVDIAPYPIDWNNIDRFKEMAKIVIEEAEKLNVPIVWGADWDMDGNIKEHKFIDWPHFELKGIR